VADVFHQEIIPGREGNEKPLESPWRLFKAPNGFAISSKAVGKRVLKTICK